MSKLSEILKTLQDVESSITTAKEKLGEYKARYEAKLSEMETKYGKVDFVKNFCKGVKGRFEGGNSKVLGALLSLEDLDTAMQNAIAGKKLDWNKVYDKLDPTKAAEISKDVTATLDKYIKNGSKFSAIAKELDEQLKALADSGNTGAFDKVFEDLGLVDVAAWKQSNILKGVDFEDIDKLEESIKAALLNVIRKNFLITGAPNPLGGTCKDILSQVCDEKYSDYESLKVFDKTNPDTFTSSANQKLSAEVFDRLDWQNPLVNHQKMVDKKAEIKSSLETGSTGLRDAIKQFKTALGAFLGERVQEIQNNNSYQKLAALGISIDNVEDLAKKEGDITAIIDELMQNNLEDIKEKQRAQITGDTRYQEMLRHVEDLKGKNIDINDFESQLGIDFNVDNWLNEKYDPAKDAIKAIKEAYLQEQKDAKEITEDLGVSTGDFNETVEEFKTAVNAAIEAELEKAKENAKTQAKEEVVNLLGAELKGLNIPIDDTNVEETLADYKEYQTIISGEAKIQDIPGIIEEIKGKVQGEATAVKEEDAKINALIEEVRAICSKSGLRLQESYKKFTEAGYTEAAANTMKKEIEDLYAESAKKEKRAKKKK